ncbi:MAG: hypothetical protein MJ231_03255, partial [bacterium]|nr:hypothetical protein [bacterium]
MGLKVFSILRNGARHLHAPKELPELSRAAGGTLPEMLAGKAKDASLVEITTNLDAHVGSLACDIKNLPKKTKASLLGVCDNEFLLFASGNKPAVTIDGSSALPDFCILRNENIEVLQHIG